MYNDLYNYSKRPQQLFRNSVFLEYCKISKKHFCFLMLQKQNVEKMGSGCYPTTVGRRNFCLLRFHPGSVRCSVFNQVDEGSPKFTILTPNLVWTPDRHRSTYDRKPNLKPFDTTCSEVARLQAHATTPSDRYTNTHCICSTQVTGLN